MKEVKKGYRVIGTVGMVWMVLLMLAMLCVPASAYYFEDIHTVKNGTVKGGVYVGGGHGQGDSPYTQNFTVPNGTILWSRLYVHVVGGGTSAETANGWLNLTYWNGTGYTENNQYLDFNYNGSANDETEGYYVDDSWGLYWKYWNVTDIVRSGANSVTATTSGFSCGQIGGIAMVTVYEDGGEEATYWINDGCKLVARPGFGSIGPGYVQSHTTWFNGTIDTSKNATLWTISAEGGDGDEDYLYFNGHKYPTNDAADGGGSTPDSTWQAVSILILTNGL